MNKTSDDQLRQNNQISKYLQINDPVRSQSDIVSDPIAVRLAKDQHVNTFSGFEA